MNTRTLQRSVAWLLAALLCLSAIVGISGGTALAAGEEASALLIAFPRSGDAARDGDWGHGALSYMNGWSALPLNHNTIYVMDDYDGEICYCIEPGTIIDNGYRFTRKDESFLDEFPAEYNHTIAAHEIRILLGRILQYGYTGKASTEWRTQTDADTMANVFATQILVWETVVGERDGDFNHIEPAGCNAILDSVSAGHPLYAQILSHYNRIAACVQKHSKVPSFCEKAPQKAQTALLSWDGAEYRAVLADENQVLSEYNFFADDSAVTLQIRGNTLIVSAATAPEKPVTIRAEKKNSTRTGFLIWSDGNYAPGVGKQDTISYVQSVRDPVVGFLKVESGFGSAKIVKTSEDGKVDGVRFRITGNGIDKTVATANGGQIQIDDLAPGEYTVTEQTEAQYEPQESRTVTVVSGQTATVTFSNTLKRGDLTVTKTAEDGLEQGAKFHLYGTSLSGLAVDEYAVVGKDGKAYFKDVLIGTGYALEEIDTPDRYAVPDDQTADIAWKQVTNKDFYNTLKKWNLTVTKQDSETGKPQGDATLAGAVYGVYQCGELIDRYTTDADGKFTTKYYLCGDNWTLREITPSEGYLIDPTEYHIGAEAKNYTVEYNAAPAIGSPEDVVKGKIAIIKHTDDGSTQIETPEVGAIFEVYLKSAGSYDAAKETERDRLVCDENGFAETKELPYGVYTVCQVSGWDGRELLPDFDVYVAKDGQVYRYLINNSNFESYIKIVKTDAETGKSVPYAGAGFQIYDPNGNLVTMTYTYPQFTTIDTFYTNAEGYLLTPEKLPYGEGYSIVEVQAPYGYVLNSDPVYFDITADNATVENAVTVVAVNRPDMPQKGKITITKTGEVFASVNESGGVYQPIYEVKGLPGAVYKITAAEDIYTPDGTLRYAKGTVVDTVTTGADGNATSKALYLGKYEIREIKAPYGMALNGEIHTVELTYAGQEIEITETATEFYNDRQRVQIDLSKVMEQDEAFDIGNNGEILSVQFGLFAAEDIVAADGSVIPKGGLIETVTCGENGHAVFTTDLPVGAKLYVKEIATDSHYILSDTQYPVNFEYAGQEVATVNITVNNGEPIENDILRGDILGHKTDRETGENIAGAVFGLFTPDTIEYTEGNAILTSVTDKDGVFQFDCVPFGSYVVVELTPAEGYLPSGEIFPVCLAADRAVVEISVTNDRIPEIPQTDDNTLGFWIGLGAMALGGLVATVILGIKRKKDEDE